MAAINATLINQDKFKDQTVFWARFVEQDEDGEVLYEIEFFDHVKIFQNLTERDISIIDNRTAVEHQTQNQETKVSGAKFDIIRSMTICFYETSEMNNTSFMEIPLKSSAILYIENHDKYCSIWSILARLHLRENSHPNTVWNMENNLLNYTLMVLFLIMDLSVVMFIYLRI